MELKVPYVHVVMVSTVQLCCTLSLSLDISVRAKCKVDNVSFSQAGYD